MGYGDGKEIWRKPDQRRIGVRGGAVFTALNPRSQIGIYSATLPSLSPKTGKRKVEQRKAYPLVQDFKDSVIFRSIPGTLQMPTNSGVGGKVPSKTRLSMAEGCPNGRSTPARATSVFLPSHWLYWLRRV